MMLSRISLLPLAVLSLLAISAKSTPDPPVAPTDKPASPPKKLPLSIRYKNQNRSVELDFEATETEAYYLIEGRTQLDEGDWSLGYGIKGDGQAQSTEMPAQSRTGFYRMQRVQEDSPLLKKDYDGDKVVALDELKRGLNAFEKVPDDSDSDGIPSDFEVLHGLDKTDASDATADADGDLYSNLEEYLGNTDLDNAEQTPAEAGESRFIAEIYEEITSKSSVTGDSTEKSILTNTYTSSPEGGKTIKTTVDYRIQLNDEDPQIILKDNSKSGWSVSRFSRESSTSKQYWEKTGEIINDNNDTRSGHYRLKNYSGVESLFLVLHTKYIPSDNTTECAGDEMEPDALRYCKESSNYRPEDPPTYQLEVVQWDGKELSIDGTPVALPTGKRKCKYEYGKVELPYSITLDFIEPKPFLENGTVVFIGNDFKGKIAQPPNRENSVTLRFVMDNLLRQDLFSGLTFEVRVPEGEDDLEDKGSLDTKEFFASGGVEPIRYLAPDESPEDHCETLEILKPSSRDFEIVAKYKDQELIVSDTISLFSRFRYVYKYSEPEDQRFTRPIALVRAKYPTMPDNTPKYNPNLKGAYGVVRTHPFLPIPAVLYIELGEAAYQNENQLASTWIHENVHLDQGRETIRKIAAGRKLYERHDAAGTDLSTIPQADKDSIHNWIVGESEAYFAEQSAYEETCLNAEGRKGVEKQLKQFSNIYHAMRN